MKIKAADREFITESLLVTGCFCRGGAEPDPFPHTPFPQPEKERRDVRFKVVLFPAATGGA